MSTSKKAAAAMKYQLTGANRKSGVNLWRFVFSAVEKGSSQERVFFIELALLNSWLNPNEAVLGFKPRVNISEDDLQNVLAGTSSAQKLQSESIVTPSYVAVRAGSLGAGARQICEYYPSKELVMSNRSFDVQIGNCRFDDSKLTGSVVCSPKDATSHPEFLCDAGTVSWNLRYDMALNFENGYKGPDSSWQIPGAKTIFTGNISMDGKEYEVLPKKSYGYVDRNWGKSYPVEWFHISSSNLASLINGKVYQNSAISIQGIYDGRVSAMLNVEKKLSVYTANSSKRKYSSVQSCSQMPETEEGEKLHWSVSISDRSHVLDVDVFCLAKLLYVRSWELPEGGRKQLKILTGGNGTGEIRLYKKHGKGLELIENCRISGVLCEFGQPEDGEQ